jgi:hypothetical protein
MLRSVNVVAAVAGLCMLAACTAGSTVSPASSPDLPVAAGLLAAVTPAKDCGGVRGVKVTPCPLVLTKQTKPGVVVTVSGPGVVNSYLEQLNACLNGRLCYLAEREGSSQIQWRIKSGTACGGADIQIDAVNAQGKQVGYAFLKVVNKYCP